MQLWKEVGALTDWSSHSKSKLGLRGERGQLSHLKKGDLDLKSIGKSLRCLRMTKSNMHLNNYST